MIYLDNAATSFPKPSSVLKRAMRYARSFCGNPGRSGHFLSVRAAEEVYATRESVADLLHFPFPERVVFTQNATHALNLAIKSTLREKSHVLTSDIEHNSVIRPLELLKRTRGIDYSVFSSAGDVYENLERAARDDTEAVISTLASNVTGKRIDIGGLSRFCTERGIKLILDASQLIGHEDIDLCRTPADVLCAPGHKALLGLQGSGFAVFKDAEVRDGLMEGGSGADSRSTEMPPLLPEHYEAGTLATPSIVSLRAGIEYINEFGINNAESYLSHLTSLASDYLREIQGVRLLGSENGIVCFTVDGYSSSEVAERLNRRHICVRAGLHCAPSIHKLLGTLEDGAVRASFSILNTEADAIGFADAVLKISKNR